jgi:hypothetical protein
MQSRCRIEQLAGISGSENGVFGLREAFATQGRSDALR